MNNNYDKAINIIKQANKSRKFNCCCNNKSQETTITVGTTITTEPDTEAKVINTGTQKKVILNFAIPKGEKGETGTSGKSVNILGSYNSLEELKNAHPEGNINDAYLVNQDLYVWDDTQKNWQNVGQIKGDKGDTGDKGEPGEKGDKGEKGEKGEIESAYLITFNAGTTYDGLAVNSNDRLPIDRKELDDNNLITLNTDEETIKFNKVGHYRISFNVSARALPNDTIFDKTKDIISIGLREINTDNIYIGSSSWVYNEEYITITSQGIVVVNDINKEYELVNLSPNTIYLNTPDIKYIKTSSYFANAIVNIIIENHG